MGKYIIFISLALFYSSCGLNKSDVYGVVKDSPTNKAIYNATIYVESINIKKNWLTTSDKDGNYKIKSVDNGQIRITASASEFISSSFLDDHMGTTKMDFSLDPMQILPSN